MLKYIDGITAEEARKELQDMLDDEYRYGQSIDRNRFYSLKYTIKVLEGDKR